MAMTAKETMEAVLAIQETSELKARQTTGLAGVEAVTKKQNRHVVIALNHMHKRRSALYEQRAKLSIEIEELEAAIEALE